MKSFSKFERLLFVENNYRNDVSLPFIINHRELEKNKIFILAKDYLGKRYKETVKGSGRYISADRTRIVLAGANDINGDHVGGPHFNFETLVPNLAKPEKYG